MDNILFGTIIKKRREELNMSQDELCEGILDRTALSRIENGKAECRKYVAEILLERLNLPVETYLNLRDTIEFEQLKIKNQLSQAMRNFEYNNMLNLIADGEKISNDNVLFKQFLKRAKASYLIYKKDFDDAKNELTDAIKLLHKTFSVESIGNMVLTYEDICILNILANIYVDTGELETAIYIFKLLIENVESKPDNDESEKLINLKSMLYYNFSRVLGRADYYKECLFFAEKGLTELDKTSRLNRTTELMMNKGYALCAMRKKEEGILVLRNALKLCEVLGNESLSEIIYSDVKELFDIDLHK